jgi:hypothetical protein
LIFLAMGEPAALVPECHTELVEVPSRRAGRRVSEHQPPAGGRVSPHADRGFAGDALVLPDVHFVCRKDEASFRSDQSQPRISLYSLSPSGEWIYKSYANLNDTVHLGSLSGFAAAAVVCEGQV